MASLLPVLPLLAASLPACAPEREKPGGADTTGEAPWDAEVSAAPLSMDAGWGTVTSSSRLEVSWSSAEAPKVQVQASLGAHTVITQVDGATTSAILRGLRSDSTYAVTVARCLDADCRTVEAAPSVEATTARMILQVAGADAAYETADPIIDNSDTKGFGLYIGPDAPAELQGTVQLYYDANVPDGKGINIAHAPAAPDSVTAPLDFTQVEDHGLRRENTGDGLAQGPQTHQAVPLASGAVRVFFEGVLYGDEGRNGRVFSIDSQDGYSGRDFHPASGETLCEAEDITLGGDCPPQLVLGHSEDGLSGVKETRQSKLLYPMFNDWLWDESAGSVLISTVHFSPDAEACSDTFFNMGLATYDGANWDLAYGADGCPQTLPGVQAPMPVHMGDGRYMVVFNANEVATMEMDTDKTLKVLYVDASSTGDPSLIEWDDFEGSADAREITTVWPDGTELTVDEERTFDDYGIFSPTGDPEHLVMYTNMSCGEGGGCAPFIGQAGWINP